MRWGWPNPLPAPWPREHEPEVVAENTRVVIADVATVTLTETMPAGREVVAGAPTARHRGLLGGDGHGSVGIWEMSEGSVRDVEVDEVFLVVGGQAVLEIDGEPAIDLRPGTLV